ncbi:hypothetical protein M1N88_02710, partial [Dehalococcoidia bacterium]|nr:hypothetical protein [Dehalococcoidia bacterium]
MVRLLYAALIVYAVNNDAFHTVFFLSLTARLTSHEKIWKRTVEKPTNFDSKPRLDKKAASRGLVESSVMCLDD